MRRRHPFRTRRRRRDREWFVVVGAVVAGLIAVRVAAQTEPTSPPPVAGSAARLTLDDFRGDGAACYDRSTQPQTAIVDSHLHFRPFGGPAIPVRGRCVQYFLEETGVLFANVYGIGQTLPAGVHRAPTTWTVPARPLTPSLKNDFVNAADYGGEDAPADLHLTLSRTFPDLADPASILRRHRAARGRVPRAVPLDGRSQSGEAGACSTTATRRSPWRDHRRLGPLHGSAARAAASPSPCTRIWGTTTTPPATCRSWKQVLRRSIRRTQSSGSTWASPASSRRHGARPATSRCWRAMLESHPEPHAGHRLARASRTRTSRRPDGQAAYVPFLNAHSERILPGTDFLASRDKDIDVYRDGAGGQRAASTRLPGRRGLPQHRPRRELLPALRAGLRGAAGLRGMILAALDGLRRAAARGRLTLRTAPPR